jgi:hypothetical protein
MEVRQVAKEVHLVAQSMKEVTPGLAKVLAKHSASLHVQLLLARLCEDGRAVFGDGSSVVADTVIYCTGYDYSFPFLDTAGAVTVDDNRVGPLFEHVFPPSLAPSLSFVGIPIKVFAPWFFEAQAKWVAQVLSGRRTLPPEEEMLRSVEEWYRSREIAGVPKKYTHDVSRFGITVLLHVLLNRRTHTSTSTSTSTHCSFICISEINLASLAFCLFHSLICSTWMNLGRDTATSLAWRDGISSCWWRPISTWLKTSRPSATTTKTPTPSARVWRRGNWLQNRSTSTKLLLLVHKYSHLDFLNNNIWSLPFHNKFSCCRGLAYQ